MGNHCCLIRERYFQLNDNSILSPIDLCTWSAEQVRTWLLWAMKEYNLTGSDVDLSKFSYLQGRDLNRMSREDFARMAGPYCGDVLYSQLNILRSQGGRPQGKLSRKLFIHCLY